MSKGDNDTTSEFRSPEEAQGLLSPSDYHETDTVATLPTPSPSTSRSPSPRPQVKRQSSLSQGRANGTPRTTNRVRFDSQEHILPSRPIASLDLDDEDYLNSPNDGQHRPLLTDITPPSSSPFQDDSFQPEDHLPNARPKSGMRSAFMNMANSIIGAGIIGQPYAFRQAGLTMGIILLIGLTIMVDWTIRLIVINSKLSGADSFQATMQHCFGKTGLIAISVAQWAFAFGGMLAFCIIVGDTIPHVIEALFPGLKDVPFLWLLTDRRAVIVLFVLAVSWPLSLYRDIAKLAKASTAALVSMIIIIVTVVTNGPAVDQGCRGSTKGLLFVNDGFFQAVGVISFGRRNQNLLCEVLTCTSICLPSQFSSDLWLTQNTHNRPIQQSHPLLDVCLLHRLSCYGSYWLPHFWRQDPGQRSQQFPCPRSSHGSDCTVMFRSQHAYDFTIGVLCLPRGHEQLLLSRRALSAKPPSDIQLGFGYFCDGHQFGDFRSWSCFRAHRSDECLCFGVHLAAFMLHQVKYKELEDGSGGSLHCVWVRCYGYQLRADSG